MLFILVAAYLSCVYYNRISMVQCCIHMCHRVVAWTSDVTYGRGVKNYFTFMKMVFFCFCFTGNLRGQTMEKSTFFFKELTPHSQTCELRGQGEKKHIQNQRQTNTSHCPTKTISESVACPLKEYPSGFPSLKNSPF